MASHFQHHSPTRRRQRSVRVTVAVALVSFAALAVVLALPTQSPGWLSASSLVALVCGAAASRIVHSELMQSRREAARDRAAQADAYRTLFAERADEHAKITTMMSDRLVARDRDLRGLEDALMLSQKRAAEAETRVKREARRANEALEQVVELREALEVRQAEEADELAIWNAGTGVGDEGSPTVADLLAWEGKVNAAVKGADEALRRKHA